MTITSFSRSALSFLFLLCCGCSDSGVQRMLLPEQLREVSGLAVDGDSLLAVADENSRIFRIRFGDGLVEYIGALGEPPLKGDFEGIAVAEGNIYLVTSDGVLYRRSLDMEQAEFDVFETGFGDLCEIEGLTVEGRHAFILCKTARSKRTKKQLTILVWDLVNTRANEEATISVPWAELSIPDKLHPSGLHHVNEQFLVIAARQRRWILIDETGSYVRGGTLPNAKDHPQAEGVAIVPGYVFIADEGKPRGTLTRYEGSF